MANFLKDLSSRFTDVLNGRNADLDTIARWCVEDAKDRIDIAAGNVRGRYSEQSICMGNGTYHGTYALTRAFVAYARAKFILTIPSPLEAYSGQNYSDNWHWMNVRSAMSKELLIGKGEDPFGRALDRYYGIMADRQGDEKLFLGFNLGGEMKELQHEIEIGEMNHDKWVAFRSEFMKGLCDKWAHAIYNLYFDPEKANSISQEKETYEVFMKADRGFRNIAYHFDEYYHAFKGYMDRIRIADISSGFAWF